MTKQNKLFSWLGFGKKKHNELQDTTDSVATEVADDLLKTTEVAVSPVATSGDQPTAAADIALAENVVATTESAVIQPEPEPESESESESGSEPVSAAVSQAAIEQALVNVESVALAAESVSSTATVVDSSPIQSSETGVANVALTEPAKKPGFFTRLKQGLAKTSQNLGSGLAALFVGKKIDDELYEELETQLLLADVGMDTTQKLIKQLTTHADRKALKNADLLYEKLQDDMALLLQDVEQPLKPENSEGPFVILMVGVNGVGKTTTIGKMAQQFKQQGKTVMLAAGDTFRAAAVEQLQVWGERNKIPVIAQHTGADSASVIFDAYQAAKARKVDILIADTAGRLQNKAHLMEELKKIVRVLQKIDARAPHEVMLTLDAGTGQNALSQAKLFNEAVPLTGISLTKLDGTAKGGVIFAIADKFKVPIRYIGVGEAIDDLRQFAAKDFIRALFNKE